MTGVGSGTGRGPRRGLLNCRILLALLVVLAPSRADLPAAGTGLPWHLARPLQRRTLTQSQQRWSLDVSSVPSEVNPNEPLIVHVAGTNPPVSQLSWTANVGGVPISLATPTVRKHAPMALGEARNPQANLSEHAPLPVKRSPPRSARRSPRGPATLAPSFAPELQSCPGFSSQA